MRGKSPEEMKACRDVARSMYCNSLISIDEIAEYVETPSSRISYWAMIGKWVRAWPPAERFDRPGMMATKSELAREDMQMIASFREAQQKRLATV